MARVKRVRIFSDLEKMQQSIAKLAKPPKKPKATVKSPSKKRG